MAKKPKAKLETESEEGIRESGEPNPPADDSHLMAVSQEPIGPAEESIPEPDNTVDNAAPQTVPVTIGGVQYEMFPEAAAAYQAETTERNSA